jgi:hypothetical protein
MYRRMVRPALKLALLATLVVLVVNACGGNQQVSKPQPLPEEREELRTGVYRTEEFEPSFTFRVGEGWSTVPGEAPESLFLSRARMRTLGFVNPREVYKPTKTGIPNIVNAPEDLVGWFRQHPYLRTDRPKHVTVGGVEGVQFDVEVENLPQGYNAGPCGPGCVAIFTLSTGYPASLSARDKLRLIILEDVKRETVTLGFVSPATEFDEFAPEAQKVIDTVEWSGGT